LDVVKEPDVIDSLIEKHDLVISLLPFTFHKSIAELCIKHRRNMVSSSYISPDLQELDEQ
jgi:saccharopine dehydrogenase-like NADP-dependent oxidoreductase